MRDYPLPLGFLLGGILLNEEREQIGRCFQERVHMERDEEGPRDCFRPEAFEGIIDGRTHAFEASLIVEPYA